LDIKEISAVQGSDDGMIYTGVICWDNANN